MSESKFVGAFTRYHRLAKSAFQSGTDFFEPDCVGFQLSPRTNGMELQTLQDTDQGGPCSDSRDKSL